MYFESQLSTSHYSDFQERLAEEIEKLRSELDQMKLRAGSLIEPTLSR